MKYLILLFLLVLTACTTTQDLQKQCAQITNSFAGEVECLENMVTQTPSMNSDSFIKEYVLTGRVLAGRLNKGEITEDEARLLFAKKYNQLRLQQQQLDTLSAREWRALEPRYQDCDIDGDRIYCRGY